MKLRYLALTGLFIITLGCFLPFQYDLWSSKTAGFWFLPILGILFLLISKEGSFGNGRILGGLFGLLIAVITIFSIIDIMSRPYAAGVYITYRGPLVILLGSLLSGIGGFLVYKRTSSPNFHLGTVLSLTGIGIIFIFDVLFSLPQTLHFALSLGNSVSWLLIFSLAMIFIGSIIIVRESRKTIQ